MDEQITKNKDEKTIKKAYVELLSFLNLINEEDYNKIPTSFITFLEENKDENYEKIVYRNVPLSEQGLLNETFDLIAFLNMKYWSKGEEE